MRKQGPKGGIAFITLMLSAMALDSDNMILPGVICLVSALQLLQTSLRKETERRRKL